MNVQSFDLVGGRFRVAVASDRGSRLENEDSWLVDESSNLIVIADGLGGLPSGALASLAWAGVDPAQIVEDLMWHARARMVHDNVTLAVGLWRGDGTLESERFPEVGYWSYEPR